VLASGAGPAGHPLPARHRHPRLRDAGGPRRPGRAAGHRRPDRRAQPRHRAALPALRLRRHGPVHLPPRRRPLGPPPPRAARGPRLRPPGGGRPRPPPHLVGAALVAAAVGAARPAPGGAGGVRAGLRRGPGGRGVGPAAVPGRPGPGLRGGRRRRPAGLPRLGRPAALRRRLGLRAAAARDRRRRRADHDHPRRQGPRVPPHDRLGNDHQAGQPAQGVSVVWNDDGTPEVRLRKDIGTANHDPRADLEAEMDVYEKLRLLYVACTRARDHLVVAVHHKTGDGSYADTVWTTAQAQPDSWRSLPAEDEDGQAAPPVAPLAAESFTTAGVTATAGESAERPATAGAMAAVSVDDDREAWIAAREALLAP